MYHLFYQCNPGSNLPGNALCHANSTNLVQWNLQSTVITDFSATGSALLLNSTTFAMIYTGGDGIVQVAYSNDLELNDWVVTDTIPALPANSSVEMWLVDTNGTTSINILSSTFTNSEAVFALYSGSSFDAVSVVSDIFSTGNVGVPSNGDFFVQGQSQTLMFSSGLSNQVLWAVGAVSPNTQLDVLNNGTADQGVLDHSASFTDDIGRRILYGLFLFSFLATSSLLQSQTAQHLDNNNLICNDSGWIPEERVITDALESTGVLSLPRQVIVNSDHSLSFPPAQELSLLRTGSLTCANNPVQYQMDYPGKRSKPLIYICFCIYEFTDKLILCVLVGGDFVNYNLQNVSNPMEECRNLCCCLLIFDQSY
jgi:hypothetical protein